MKTFKDFIFEQDIVTYPGVRLPAVDINQQPQGQAQPQAQPQLSQNNFGGNKQLEAFTINEVKKQGLDTLQPSDAAEFFPGGKITPEGWANLLSLVSYKESGWNPNTTFKEGMKNKKGETVISTGLYQLSYESVGYYGFNDVTTEKLKDPYFNTIAAITIMKRGIERTGRIEQNNSYWSVLRPNHRNYAGSFIKKGVNPAGSYAGSVTPSPGNVSDVTPDGEKREPESLAGILNMFKTGFSDLAKQMGS